MMLRFCGIHYDDKHIYTVLHDLTAHHHIVIIIKVSTCRQHPAVYSWPNAVMKDKSVGLPFMNSLCSGKLHIKEFTTKSSVRVTTVWNGFLFRIYYHTKWLNYNVM